MKTETIRLKKYHQLIKQGDALKNLFILKSGSIKEVSINEDGSSFITKFHFKGDVLGLNSIDLEYHPTSFLTLEDTIVEKFNFQELLSNSVSFHYFFTKISESVTEYTIRKRVFTQKSEGKISSLLLELFNKNPDSPDYFNMSMTREDIANHLGLSEFTVSRILSKLQKESIIEIKAKSRSIKLIDKKKLENRSL